MSESYVAKLNAHYGHPNLGQAILDWLQAQGKDINALTIEDLAIADQYHGGGLASNANLAQLAGVTGPLRIADLGGALGGPARYLATTFGCTVDVVDLSTEFCSSGELLTRQMGLSDKVHFFLESATKTSLPSGVYDQVWMQNVSMNIEDRVALYAEIWRLLGSGGVHVFQETCAGDNEPAYYPTGWASDASESFLYKPEVELQWFLNQGFRVLSWVDETLAFQAANAASNVARTQAASNSTAPLPHYSSAEKLRLGTANVARNAAEGRVRYLRGLLQKP